MIKRIRLGTARSGLGRDEFAGCWREAVGAAALAPAAARPVRVTVSVAVREIADGQRYDGVGLEWFSDREHLLRFESWLGAGDGEMVGRLLSAAVEVDDSPVVVTSERVARGADWLERRWREGGTRLKQLAIANRADGLTLAQFLERWHGRAGAVGAAPIPDAFRGRAYVQNHPLVEAGLDWAYDAINEVYFDDADSLRARMAYFERELAEGGENDLVGANWFLAMREEPIELPVLGGAADRERIKIKFVMGNGRVFHLVTYAPVTVGDARVSPPAPRFLTWPAGRYVSVGGPVGTRDRSG